MVSAGGYIYASDVNYIIARSYDKPICRLVQQSAQSFADNTATAITFGSGSEVVDSANMHNVSSDTSRITPTVAGWYRVSGKLVVPAGTDYASLEIYIRKNGSTNIPSVSREGPNATSSSRTIYVDHLVDFNGTTDYVELMATQDNTSSASRNTPSNGGSFSCTFEAVYEADL
jgi:hypothetical protein